MSIKWDASSTPGHSPAEESVVDLLLSQDGLNVSIFECYNDSLIF